MLSTVIRLITIASDKSEFYSRNKDLNIDFISKSSDTLLVLLTPLIMTLYIIEGIQKTLRGHLVKC